MKALSLAVFSIIVTSACSVVTANKISPKFYSDYFVGLETTKITTYDKAILDYDLTSQDNKNVHFNNCKQVESVKDEHILISEFHLLTMLRLNCKALKQYTLASASQKSYLNELLDKKDISHLPATVYPYVNEYDRTSRLNRKLSEFYKKLDIKIANDGAIDVTTDTDMLLYQVVSTGDFNGDKIEDALIRIDWHVIDGFGKGSKLVLVTKKSDQLDFEEISAEL